MTVDYRRLLAKYMLHVAENEGVTFLGGGDFDGAALRGQRFVQFTDAEWVELKLIESEMPAG